MNKQSEQAGFTAVEAVLIFVIITLLGLVGFYVFRNRDTGTDDKSGTTSVQQAETAAAPDPTADWKSYTSGNGKFTIKYPATWVGATNPELCSENILLLGADSASVGKCASESFGQVAFVWRSDIAACESMSSVLWAQDSQENVTIAGLPATKTTATAKSVDPDAGLGVVPAGTKAVEYCVVANNKVYTATYTQLAGYPDALADFNTLVTKTWQFN